MTASAMPQIKVPRIGDAKPLQAFGKIGPFCLKQEMVVVIHKHIGKDFDLKSGSHSAQNLQKRCSVFLIGNNGTAFVAPGEHMI
jgi:hypothetical protein